MYEVVVLGSGVGVGVGVNDAPAKGEHFAMPELS